MRDDDSYTLHLRMRRTRAASMGKLIVRLAARIRNALLRMKMRDRPAPPPKKTGAAEFS